jgi:hypothetical protein
MVQLALPMSLEFQKTMARGAASGAQFTKPVQALINRDCEI